MRKVLLEGWQKGCHSGQLKQPFAVLSSWVMADYSHKNHETYMLLQSLKADEHYHWFKVCFSMSLWLLSFWKMLPKQVHNWEKKTVFGSKKVAQKWAKQKTHKIQPFKTHKLSFMVKLLIETASVEYTICSHRQLSADPESRWIHLYKESLSCTPQLWCVMMLLFSLSLLRGRTICL